MVDYSNIPRDSRRVPLETRVQFKFDRFSGFVSEYSANISPGGLFLRTRAPQPQGTVLDLEFRLGDGFELIKGRGEVVWNRLEDDGPLRPAGMGVRFLELAPGSKELIYRIVDEHIAQGGTPFDLTMRPPDPVPAAAPSVAPWPPAAPPSSQGDVFDLPPPIAPPDASAWAPSLEEAPPESHPRAGEPFPELFETPMPAPPPSNPGPMFASTFRGGAATPDRKARRLLPLAVLAAVLLLAVGAYLLQDTLRGMVGLGAEEEIAQATPPPARPSPQPRPRSSTPPGLDPLPAAPTGAAPEPSVVPSAAAPPAATTPSAAPAAAPAPGPALETMERITWEEVPGGTDVILWGDGAIRSDTYSRTRIEGNPPRELVRLTGIRRPFGQARIVAGTRELLQVRTGYHPGNQLHVVLDLAHPSVQVAGVEEGARQLRIHLKRR